MGVVVVPIVHVKSFHYVPHYVFVSKDVVKVCKQISQYMEAFVYTACNEFLMLCI